MESRECYLNSLRKAESWSVNVVITDVEMFNVPKEGITLIQRKDAEMSCKELQIHFLKRRNQALNQTAVVVSCVKMTWNYCVTTIESRLWISIQAISSIPDNSFIAHHLGKWIPCRRDPSWQIGPLHHRVQATNGCNGRTGKFSGKPLRLFPGSISRKRSTHEAKEDIKSFLQRNFNIFTWKHEDMMEIDPRFSCHCIDRRC